MSTPAKQPAPVKLTLEDMKKLKSRNRPRFTDEQVMRALAYQRDHNCTLAVAAATEGMTNQTLAKRRDELFEKMSAGESQAVKPASKKK